MASKTIKSCSDRGIRNIEHRLGMPHNENPSVEYVTKLTRLDNEDRRDDQHRRMAWFALSGLVIYPLLVMFTDYVQLDKASQLISDMSSIYFPSMSVIVMTLFGASAYKDKKEFHKDPPEEKVL